MYFLVVTTPREDLEFLFGVSNRLRTIEELADSPATQKDLVEATGTSRFTVSRYLDGFLERGWVERDDSNFHLTPLGHALYEEILKLVDTIDTLSNLDDLVSHLPLDEMDFDLSALQDANVIRPTPTDPFRQVRRSISIYDEADRAYILTHGFSPEHFEKIVEKAIEGAHIDMVTTQEIAEMVSGREDIQRGLSRTNGNVQVLVHPGDVPFLMAFSEEKLSLSVVDEQAQPKGTIETQDAKVLEWAHHTFERYLEEAEKIEIPDEIHV